MPPESSYGVLVKSLIRIGDAHLGQQLDHAFADSVAASLRKVKFDAFGDLPANRE
jgi:hypothetical protein